MAKHDKVLARVLSGVADANVTFADLRLLLGNLNFEERIRGGHHIFTRNGVIEIVNTQPKGSMAKAY
ncbi:MAG TPA: type II toxin-antitoxin system HicA family toxin [Candidatus Hydrogenedentes bacterium]|nr:type II toxin-antitoxin system HicA family toxin [Candidatus Hydrogenedentota bacterium]